MNKREIADLLRAAPLPSDWLSQVIVFHKILAVCVIPVQSDCLTWQQPQFLPLKPKVSTLRPDYWSRDAAHAVTVNNHAMYQYISQLSASSVRCKRSMPTEYDDIYLNNNHYYLIIVTSVLVVVFAELSSPSTTSSMRCTRRQQMVHHTKKHQRHQTDGIMANIKWMDKDKELMYERNSTLIIHLNCS